MTTIKVWLAKSEERVQMYNKVKQESNLEMLTTKFQSLT